MQTDRNNKQWQHILKLQPRKWNLPTKWLIDKALRNGYDNAVKYLNDEDKSFLAGIKNANLDTEMAKWEQQLYALK